MKDNAKKHTPSLEKSGAHGHAHRDSDSRIKSPDEMIRHLVVTKIQTLTKALECAHQKHLQDINQWKEYEKDVNAWKAQVTTIVEDLQKKAEENTRLLAENQSLKQQLKNQSSPAFFKQA